MPFAEFIKLLFNNYTPLKDDFNPKPRKIKDDIALTEFVDNDGNIKYTIVEYKNGKVVFIKVMTEEELKSFIQKEKGKK